MNTPNGTFTFQCVLRFEIDPETAANLLVESDSTKTVHNWLLTQLPTAKNDYPYSGNVAELKRELSNYLGEKAIEKARLLLPCTDESKLISQ